MRERAAARPGVNRVGSKFGIAVNAGAPQIAYREGLGRRVEIDHTHKTQARSNRRGQPSRKASPRRSASCSSIMKVEVVPTEDCLGEVSGDLNNSHGQIQGIEARGMTRGRAAYSMTFDHYAPVPMRPDDDDPFAPAAALRA